jgi:hypothetical protein
MQFLGVGAAASAGSLAGTAAADGAALTTQQRQMVLAIARTGVVFPVAFRDHGEPGPAACDTGRSSITSCLRRS